MSETRELFDGAMSTEFVGRPEGPPVYVEAFGMEVGSFIDPRHDLNKSKTQWGTLMHHVPVDFRGPYKGSPNGELVDDAGWALCNGVKKDGGDCDRRAQNRSGYCTNHGGQLHPLDRRKFDWSKASREVLFRNNKLSVEELTDEELVRGSIKREDGTWINNKVVPRAFHDRMVRELFRRADEHLQHSLLDVVETMTEIAKGTAYEPADRIKAATWVFERVRGKVPTEVVVSQDKPWEIAMEGIVGGSREESRKRRATIIDAEVEDVEFEGQAPASGEDPALERGGVSHGLSYADMVEASDVDAELYGEPLQRDDEVVWDAPGAPVHDEGDHAPAPEQPEPEARPKRPSPEAIAAERARVREEIDKAKRKRYASAAKGFTDVEAIPYEMKAAKAKDGLTKVTFHEPKLKAAPKRKRNDHE